MPGNTHHITLEKAFIEQQRRLDAEQQAIDDAVAELPEPFLAPEEGDLDHPIVLGSYLRRRKAARGR